MAHSNRNHQRERRLNQKRARKAARQAAWDLLKGTTKNKKKKTGNKNTSTFVIEERILITVVKYDKKGKLTSYVERRVHGGEECGNIGCKRCSSLWR